MKKEFYWRLEITGQGELFQNETVLALAKKYSVTPALASLAWSLAEEFLPLPKSVTPERARQSSMHYNRIGSRRL